MFGLKGLFFPRDVSISVDEVEQTIAITCKDSLWDDVKRDVQNTCHKYKIFVEIDEEVIRLDVSNKPISADKLADIIADYYRETHISVEVR